MKDTHLMMPEKTQIENNANKTILINSNRSLLS